MGYRMRAGCSAIACGPPIPRALHAWPLQPLQGPHGGSLFAPGWKEPVLEYNSDSDTAPGHASDSNPLFGFYSDSAYEFDFGSDPEDPDSEDQGRPLGWLQPPRLPEDSSTGQTVSPQT
jgi:hypothetical protein